MQFGRTPLHYAAEKGHSSTTKVLLKAGADASANAQVSSCVAIGRDLSDICYSGYGSIRFALQKLSLLHASMYLHTMIMMT